MLVPDREVPGAYFVRIDGTDQSFVDPNCSANGGCPLRDSGTLAFTDDGGATWHVMGE